MESITITTKERSSKKLEKIWREWREKELASQHHMNLDEYKQWKHRRIIR
jgi:hypothetical protein